MKIRFLSIIAITSLLCITLCLGKSYSVERVQIEARVLPDGGLAVEESIRYRFRGSFRFAYRDIPLKEGESIEQIRVSEGNREYSGSPGQEPGSYAVEPTDRNTRITWYYEARDQVRTFRLSYLMRGVVKRHADIAEMYYQFVGDRWDRPIERVQVALQLPGAAVYPEVRAWAHGPLHGRVSLPGPGRVHLDVSPLPAHTFWEGRVLFPAAWVAGLPAASNQPRLEAIMAEEKTWAEEANRRRAQLEADQLRREKLAGYFLPIALLVTAASIGFWLRLFWRYGKPYPMMSRPVPGEIPSSDPPALASYLMHRRVGATAIVTTLVDLARRGYFVIHEERISKRGWFGTRTQTDYRFELADQELQNLLPFERDLLEFVFEHGGDEHGFRISEFKKAATRKRSLFLKWFKSWRKEVEGRGREKRFFEPWPVRAILLNSLCGIVLTGLGIVILVLSGSEIALLPMIVGPVQAAFSVFLSRRTPQGQALFLAWKEFKNHLRSISRAMSPISLESPEWGRYIVASILLGIHKPFARFMEQTLSERPAHYVPWYVGHAPSGAGFEGLGAGLSGMVTSVGSTMASASGTGGGASGGGGGGSGGGGGGAG